MKILFYFFIFCIIIAIGQSFDSENDIFAFYLEVMYNFSLLIKKMLFLYLFFCGDVNFLKEYINGVIGVFDFSPIVEIHGVFEFINHNTTPDLFLYEILIHFAIVHGYLKSIGRLLVENAELGC